MSKKEKKKNAQNLLLNFPMPELVKLDDLSEYENNPRINDDAVVTVAGSIKDFDFLVPIISHKGVIVAGHTRLKAARQLGLSHVLVTKVDDWSEEKANAFRILENATHEKATWDHFKLGEELTKLPNFNFANYKIDFSSIFDSKKPDVVEDGAVSKPPENPVTRLGDMWLLDNHRVICGDSTSDEVAKELLQDITPVLMVTDPPYGVEYDANWRNQTMRPNGEPYGAKAVGKVLNDDRADWFGVWKLWNPQVIYCWHAGIKAAEVQLSLEKDNYKIVSQIIWAKPIFVFGRGDYHWKHEPCWYAVRNGSTHNWLGDRKQSTIWEIDNNNTFSQDKEERTGHSTQKPVRCMAIPMQNNSLKGDVVCDPFLGSGTTLIAAEQLGRRCLGAELNPIYVDIIIDRWQRLTGKEAKLQNGKTFKEISEERLCSNEPPPFSPQLPSSP